jgi:starch synthase
MLALRYGSIPIVRKTGGLGDTISEGKNGFVFSGFNAREMQGACLRAAEAYRNQFYLKALIQRAMKCDFSWEAGPVKKYIAMYQEVIKRW